jgi:hypothetical protein
MNKYVNTKLNFLFVFFLLSSVSYSQFLDFNIFRPQVSIMAESVFDNPYDSLSLGVMDYGVSALIPIKQKFAVNLNWENIFKSKGLKDAFKQVVTPKFYQVFSRIGAGYRTYNSELFNSPVNVNYFSAGITGVSLKLKGGKFKFMMYSLNARLQEEFGKYNQVSPWVSGLVGTAKIFDYRTGFFYGIYANYFGGRITPAPVLVFYYKLNRKSTFTLAFPTQIKYAINFGNIKQDFAISLTSYNNGVFNDSIIPNQNIDRLNFQNSQLRFSSQTRFMVNKKAFFYLEAGWQDINKVSFYNGYDTYKNNQLKGNVFVKAKFSLVLGKSIINPSIFDMDL